jgi:hypothetical protein
MLRQTRLQKLHVTRDTPAEITGYERDTPAEFLKQNGIDMLEGSCNVVTKYGGRI